MSRPMLSLVLCAAGCALGACDKTVPTAPGTVLLDRPPMSKLSVTSWTLGAPKGPLTKVERTYRYEPGSLGAPVRFKVSFEHGPTELVEAQPKPEKHPPPVQAPRTIKLEVVENSAWAMSGKCDDDLAVPLAVNPDGTSAYPASVWARCMVVMKRKNGDITVAPWVTIHGTGEVEVKAIPDDHKVTVEP